MKIDLDRAVEILQSGGVVAFPTETVYGLGAIAENVKAVDRIYRIKKRPRDNPLICHFYSIEQIKEYVKEIPELAEKLLHEFSPGPLSLLLNLMDLSQLSPATAGLSTIIIRIPDQELTLKLIKKIGKPIVGPSANTSGKFSGTSPEMIETDLGQKIDGILDGGRTSIGLESTIIDCRSHNEVKILRQGAIGEAEIQKFLAKEGLSRGVEITFVTNKTTQVTPGSKYKHYAPVTPVQFVRNLEQIPDEVDVALLADSNSIQSTNQKVFKKIDLGMSLEAIAKNLYWSFYQLDNLEVKHGYIFISRLNKTSLSKAIIEKINKVIIAESEF